jgi:serine/threonine protein kinase
MGFVKKMVKDVLTALNFLQQKDFAHLDVKPENILVDINKNNGIDHFVLADFGSAEQAPSLSKKVHQTFFYRPPESLLECGGYTIKADMWGVGCVIAEVSRGMSLFAVNYGEQEKADLCALHLKRLGSPSLDEYPQDLVESADLKDQYKEWHAHYLAIKDTQKRSTLEEFFDYAAKARPADAQGIQKLLRITKKFLSLHPSGRPDPGLALQDPDLA